MQSAHEAAVIGRQVGRAPLSGEEAVLSALSVPLSKGVPKSRDKHDGQRERQDSLPARERHSARRRLLRDGLAPYLQHCHLLPVAEQAEGQWVFGVQAGDDLAAAERDGHDVRLQVGSILVEDELVILDSAPALPPAAIGEHVQVT